MHTWLPDAYSEAPDPVSSLLSGIATETALFALIRVLYTLFEPNVFMIPIATLSILTMTFGNIVHQTGNRDIKKMHGLGKMMPFTTLAITVAMLGLGGVPGTSGFISKFVLFSAPLGAGLPILAVVGVLNAALSMAYYLRVVMTLLSDNGSKNIKIKEAPLIMVGITSIMAILIVVLGIYPNPIMGISSEASKALIDGLRNYIGA